MFWCAQMLRNNTRRLNQRGNVFIFVLLGVILFAALMFTVSRGLNTGASTLSQAQARNYAVDIIGFGQKIERAITRLLDKGVSEGDISFENVTVSGYDHTPAVPTDARIFERADALGAPWQNPIPQSTGQGNNQWFFDGSWIIEGIASDSMSELALYLIVRREVCAEINKYLGRTVDLGVALTPSISLAKFTGTYLDNVAQTMSSTVTGTGCYPIATTAGAESGSYVFVQVLLAR